MTTISYCFEAFVKLKDGALVFSRDGIWTVEVELDVKTTDGDDWDIEAIRLVEPHINRAQAEAFEVTEDGPLLQSIKAMIAGDWRDAIGYHVAAEYEPPADERATEEWKETAA